MNDILSRLLSGVIGHVRPALQQGTTHLPGEDPGSGELGGHSLGSLLDGLLGHPGGLDLNAMQAGAAGMGGVKGVVLMALLATLTRGSGGARGLSALVDRLRAVGLGPQVDSWIAQGGNQPADPAILERALPTGALAEIERRTGIGREEILSQLSRGLPRMVDGMTPHGRMPGGDHEMPDGDEDEVMNAFGIRRSV